MTPYLAAFAACLAGAVLEGALSGSGVRARFAVLRLPAYSPVFAVWVVIGLAYYGLCFVLLSRLLAAPDRTALHWTAVGIVGVVLVVNGYWNYVFFRLRSLRGAFLLFIPYGALVLALTGIMTQLDLLGAALLGCYCAYLVYATWWSYRLWRMNEWAS
jgi:tryptophan-rich sensory protein